MARPMKAEMTASLHDDVSGKAGIIQRSLHGLSRAGNASTRMMESGVRATGRLGSAMGLAAMQAAGVGVPLAAGLAVQTAVTQAADFESALTGIQKKAGLTQAATTALGEEIKDLASGGEVAVGIDEIAAAYERGAAAGLPIDTLREFALQSVKAADAFEMSAEETGNFASKLQTALGMSSREVRQVLDLTNSLADAGISDERDIVSFMDRAGATMKTLGMAKEETLALGATLLNIGMPAEVASTGMSNLAGRMLTVNELTGKSKKTFEKYMGSTENFAELVEKDANGALLSMLDTLKDLDKTDRMSFLSSFVGREWADEMLRLVEATDEYRRNLSLANDERQWGGSLDASYQLKLDNFWSQWQIAKNALAEIAIDAGTAGMPLLKSGLEEVRALVDEIQLGMGRFEATLDIEGLDKAKNAVSDLIGAVTGLMNLNGEDSAIVRFFERIAHAANAVSEGIGIVQDVAQGLGLAEDDGETKLDRHDRREAFLDGIVDASPAGPVIKPAIDVIKGVDDVVSGVRSEEEDATIRADMERRRAQMAGVSGQTPADLEAQRQDYWRRRNIRMGQSGAVAPDAGNIRLPDLSYPTAVPSGLTGPTIPVPAPRPQSAASPSPASPSAGAALAEIREIDQLLGQLYEKKRAVEDGFRLALDPSAVSVMRQIGDEMERLTARRAELDAMAHAPAPTPPASEAAVPIPQPRPDIAASIASEVDQARAAAQQGGQDIASALSVRARPEVDPSAIRAAIADARTLNAELTRTSSLAASAARAAAEARNAASASRADMSGLHANTSRPG
ncbi:phage tail tape measure protein, TP901 family, core region [Fulvimarina manganoxydans]|uniref:Phage tail tape measure protein, TP901 family, core region n=1 Tax=Fulvimarina manganoxydans TaxID=937218 RepID=A0A1W2EJS2_9HYPH|nr:phage tail tape measure protein [Fulvimarina manganoxydans]SMD09957.1 phage tail tape measure protein, TP901 family, core region [Fulvimarina manganoxydans]